MSSAKYIPTSLTPGEPICSLVPPGQCQLKDTFTPIPLLERIAVSKTSSILRFGLPDPNQPLNLSTCACILAKASMKKQQMETGSQDGDYEDVIRPYTPISTNALKGCFDLLIKNYAPTGKLSRYLHEIPIGTNVEFKHSNANVKIQAPFHQKHIVMIAGGTGITPMIQALHAILGDSDKTDGTHVTLIYGSRVADDILAQELLDAWSKTYSNRFTLVHILSHEPDDKTSLWTGPRGHITKEVLETYVPNPTMGEDLIIFVCGPPPMYDALCGPRNDKELTGTLAEMGYHANQVYKF